MHSWILSFRGRITRVEYLLGTCAWLVFLITCAAFYKSAVVKFGHTIAFATYGGVVVLFFVGLDDLVAKRGHDLGFPWRPWPHHVFAHLFHRGAAEPNIYGPPPKRGRVWWLSAALIIFWILFVKLLRLLFL